jgi:hypothetical protein
MAVGRLSSRISLTDAVTGRVAVVRGCLVEVVDRVSDRCMAPRSGIPDPAVVFTESATWAN